MLWRVGLLPGTPFGPRALRPLRFAPRMLREGETADKPGWCRRIERSSQPRLLHLHLKLNASRSGASVAGAMTVNIYY